MILKVEPSITKEMKEVSWKWTCLFEYGLWLVGSMGGKLVDS